MQFLVLFCSRKPTDKLGKRGLLCTNFIKFPFGLVGFGFWLMAMTSNDNTLCLGFAFALVLNVSSQTADRNPSLSRPYEACTWHYCSQCSGGHPRANGWLGDL